MRRPNRLTILPFSLVVSLTIALGGCAKQSAPATHAPDGSDRAISTETALAEAPAGDAAPAPEPMMAAPVEEDAAMVSSRAESELAPAADESRARPRTRWKERREAKKALEAGEAGEAGGWMQPPADPGQLNTEAYEHIAENDFIAVADDPLSTFSIDVDTASYSNVRRFLRDGMLPPPDAVRIEELVNYFDYDYRQPAEDKPFSVTAEVSECPWNPNHRLVHVGLQGKIIDSGSVPPRNLVFLIDVSGSMDEPAKLPLLKESMRMLAASMRPEDRVSMVVYAGASGIVLEPTSSRAEIVTALDRLSAGGSTNGGEGIELAYRIARQAFIPGGINRVILATDGDFNVGVTSEGDLTRLIEAKRRTGVYLSVLGFGTGNYKDATMEMLADKGNGNYAYIDSEAEAHKVLVQEAGATLVTIAKDVKLQLELNPAEVASYRLIGYENRKLAHQDFEDDRKDAGEIGAGHSVTALYEIVPAGRGGASRKVPALVYQQERTLSNAARSGELMTVKIRYKAPGGVRSKLLSFAVHDDDRPLQRTSADFRFSAAVAAFGMLLRNSEHRGSASWDRVLALAESAIGKDPHGHRRELLELVGRAAELSGQSQQRSASVAK